MTRTIALIGALSAMAMTASAARANTGPVGQWKLDEGRGTVVADSSGFGDNGTLLGGVGWTAGPAGPALGFDGVSGAVHVPDAPQLEPSASVSVAAWVARSGSPGAYKYVLAKGGNRCTSAAYGLYSGPSGGLVFYISRGHGSVYARSPDAGSGVWDGRWHLAVGTFDGTTIRLFLDGAEVGTGTEYPGPIEYLLNDTNDLFIGDYPSCGNMDFPGAISNVRIWDRALSESEVPALSAPSQQPSPGGGDPPSPSGPVLGPPASGASGPGARPPRPNPPVIRRISLSASTLILGSGASVRGPAPVIAYSDSASSRVTFTILRLQSKAARTRCIKTARLRHRNTKAYCPRYVALGRFVHEDRAGRNVVRFPRALIRAPGSYLLYVTPSLNGSVGKTVVIPFKVVSRRW